MAVLAFVDDVVFQSKLEAAAMAARAQLQVAREPSEAGDRDWTLILVDLERDRGDPVALVSTLRQVFPMTPIVGYCSHAATSLQARAKAAGCSQVLARSELVQSLPALVRGGPIG